MIYCLEPIHEKGIGRKGTDQPVMSRYRSACYVTVQISLLYNNCLYCVDDAL